ncbi:hypothetical protein TFKS16_1715 [Tannerella forsythia KS16]|uniref:Uncharacterized protein n=1 Tax=Tannerella forsythia (strain ATCC 43037 / JCM 10827 / CCUG 21028 A / KCTC 5666 / FDC 338) TaxID=203275 RepID=G8UPN8_TANFA|nr:hypothetical protein BFO_1929 [Tannerella forsythia 92A2]BAR49267.1 hypothetical protein TF3313_1772 [Tannerella forsythia 3313]BAR51951.1 hypothetical protein TFKS16_1715 [Tannerella forsythia KS16]
MCKSKQFPHNAVISEKVFARQAHEENSTNLYKHDFNK